MSVISFRKSVSELDQFAAQSAAIQQALARCIRSAGQYAVELEKGDAEILRNHLDRLAEVAMSISDPHSIEQLQADLRGELRAYRDQAQGEAQELRQQVASAVSSVQALISTVTTTGSDHERALQREFAGLEAAADTGNLEAIRAAVRQTVDAALRSCEEIRKSREMIIAQLQDEIRSLHREVEQERRAGMEDPVTHLWNRVKLDDRVQDLILLNETFCIFLIGIRNLSRLTPSDPRAHAGCLGAFAKRLRNQVGDSDIGMAGRWSEDTFAVVFNLPVASTPSTVLQLQRILCGNYSVQVDGTSHTMKLDVSVQSVERLAGSNEGTFFMNLGQAAFSVTAH